jgi:NTP pyrophosphatase (non-canonical NTP hydrolase)
MGKIGINSYQKACKETWISSGNKKDDIVRCALALAGESGEVCEKIKKYLRGDGKLNVEELQKELGDVLYYIAQMGNLCKIDLSSIADYNVKKLRSRKQRGVIRGSGDSR